MDTSACSDSLGESTVVQIASSDAHAIDADATQQQPAPGDRDAMTDDGARRGTKRIRAQMSIADAAPAAATKQQQQQKHGDKTDENPDSVDADNQSQPTSKRRKRGGADSGSGSDGNTPAGRFVDRLLSSTDVVKHIIIMLASSHKDALSFALASRQVYDGAFRPMYSAGIPRMRLAYLNERAPGAVADRLCKLLGADTVLSRDLCVTRETCTYRFIINCSTLYGPRFLLRRQGRTAADALGAWQSDLDYEVVRSGGGAHALTFEVHLPSGWHPYVRTIEEYERNMEAFLAESPVARGVHAACALAVAERAGAAATAAPTLDQQAPRFVVAGGAALACMLRRDVTLVQLLCYFGANNGTLPAPGKSSACDDTHRECPTVQCEKAIECARNIHGGGAEDINFGYISPHDPSGAIKFSAFDQRAVDAFFGSDIDIYCTRMIDAGDMRGDPASGRAETELTRRAMQLADETLRSDGMERHQIVQNSGLITLIPDSDRSRRVQLVTRLHRCTQHLLAMFDLDAIRIAYDPCGRAVWGLTETMCALRTGVSVVEHKYAMLRPTLDRVDKYRDRGFLTCYYDFPLWHVLANAYLKSPRMDAESRSRHGARHSAPHDMAVLLSDAIPDSVTREEIAGAEALRQQEEDYPTWLGRVKGDKLRAMSDVELQYAGCVRWPDVRTMLATNLRASWFDSFAASDAHLFFRYLIRRCAVCGLYGSLDSNSAAWQL